jgi:beta-glucosidase
MGAVPHLTYSNKIPNFGVVVDVSVQNAGTRAGAEVVELYIKESKPKIDRPLHELKAFQRVELQPGETKWVHFRLDRSAFSYWDPAAKAWTTDAGEYEIQVGSSSRDLRQKKVVNIPAAWLRK